MTLMVSSNTSAVQMNLVQLVPEVLGLLMVCDHIFSPSSNLFWSIFSVEMTLQSYMPSSYSLSNCPHVILSISVFKTSKYSHLSHQHFWTPQIWDDLGPI